VSGSQVIISGFGGQGVITAGQILGRAVAVHERRNAVMAQSYGPESRGGACKTEVILSDDDIEYPRVVDPGKRSVTVPATRLAEELGKKVVLNIVTLGFLCGASGIVSPEALKEAIAKSVPKGTEALNLKAFEAGYAHAKAPAKAPAAKKGKRA
jgi:2-oxoglutarate ferredoxin oxidoreductase subunit gamma